MRGFLFLFLVLPGACTQSVSMYPVEGPLSARNPLPVVVAEADGISGNTGNFTFPMPDGQSCAGKWSSAAPKMVASSWGTLFTKYGTITGLSTTVANQPGVNRGQAFAICSDNTKFDIEFITGSGTANGFGIARDSTGNVYKMIF